MTNRNSVRGTVPAILALLITLTAGCDLFGDEKTDPVIVTESVVVANGGNFSDQNGFLTFYDPASESTTKSVDLGGFAHAIAIHDDEIFVLLNTFSVGRISVIDRSGVVQRQIQGVPGPRGIAFVDDASALVTNLSPFGAEGPEPAVVSVVDVKTGTVEEGGIDVGLYPEGIVTLGGNGFVANSGNLGDGTTLSVLDVSSKAAVGSIDLGCDGPNEVFVESNDRLLVVCEGKVVYNEDFTEIIEQTVGQIVVVDASSRSVVSRVVLATQAGSENGSQSAYLDAISGELYVIDSATSTVYRFATDSNSITATIKVPDAEDLVGLAAVAYDRSSRSLYVARLARGPGGFPDFSASGAVVVLDRTGKQVGRFTVGPAPSHIEFFRTSR